MTFSGATVVFDLDGTLVDTAPDLVVAVNHALRSAGLQVSPYEVILPAVSLGARRMIEAGLQHQNASVGQEGVDELTRVMLAFYTENVAVESRPYEGLLDVLRQLSEDGAILAVCTNKMEVLSRRLLLALELDRHFAAVCGRDTFPTCKPHPGHLTETIARAGGRVDDAYMIGDSDVDVATAKAAGVPVVGVTHGYSAAPVATFGPDAVIDSYAELLPALIRLRSAA